MGCHWLTLFLVYLSLCHNGNSWNPQAPREVKWFASKYCADGKGNNGTCISLQSCFADLRFPHLSGWSEFVTGDYISCAYITSQGVPFVGACCIKQSKPPSDPVIMTTENSETSPLVTQRPIFLPIPPNWPPTHPPLPTHPPHVTIPELPTHPPVAFPGIPWPWTTKRPVRKTVRPPTTIILPWIRPKSSTTTTTAAPSTLSPAGSIEDANGAGQRMNTACGRQNDSFRVVNGKLAGYWPWMAGIIGRKGLFCGGSLISNYHILTAAHCVDRLSPGMITVRLGDQDLSSTADHNHIDVKVSSITIHPGYNTRTSQQDVAILRLASKVTFNNHIKPVCLPQNTERSYAEDTAVVIGWGATRNRGPTSKVLMELSIRVWSVAQCQQRFQKNFPGQIAATNICAGEGGKDACSGDSGGPLMKHENGVFTQIGIVSWGVGCGIYHYPGVYTRVTSFVNWIKSNLV